MNNAEHKLCDLLKRHKLNLICFTYY